MYSKNSEIISSLDKEAKSAQLKGRYEAVAEMVKQYMVEEYNEEILPPANYFLNQWQEFAYDEYAKYKPSAKRLERKEYAERLLSKSRNFRTTEKYLLVPPEWRLFEMLYLTYVANPQIISELCGDTGEIPRPPEVEAAYANFAEFQKQFLRILKQVITTHVYFLERDPRTHEVTSSEQRGEDSFSEYWTLILGRLSCVAFTDADDYLPDLLLNQQLSRYPESENKNTSWLSAFLSRLFKKPPEKLPEKPPVKPSITRSDLHKLMINLRTTLATSIDFGLDELELDGAETIGAGLRVNTSLKTVSVKSAGFGDEGINSILTGLLENTTLKSLDISDNNTRNISQSVAAVLRSKARLEELVMQNSDLHDAGAALVLSSLSSNTSLTSLDLESNDIDHTEELLKLLAGAQHLQHLSLKGNKFSVERALSGDLIETSSDDLIEAPTGGLIETSSSDLTETSIDDLIEAPINLKSLNIEGNNMKDEGIPFFVFFLRNCIDLVVLNISSNKLGSAGIRELLLCLIILPSLKELDLSDNNFGDDGVLPVALWLHTAALTKINLGLNAIGDVSAKELASALADNSSLRSLSLFGNAIKTEGASSLALALNKNTSLKELSFFGVNMAVNNDLEPRLEANRYLEKNREKTLFGMCKSSFRMS